MDPLEAANNSRSRDLIFVVEDDVMFPSGGTQSEDSRL
jgi:hypothetical protein